MDFVELFPSVPRDCCLLGEKKNSFNSIEEEEKFEWLENLRLSVFLRISLNNIIEKVKGKGKERIVLIREGRKDCKGGMCHVTADSITNPIRPHERLLLFPFGKGSKPELR